MENGTPASHFYLLCGECPTPLPLTESCGRQGLIEGGGGEAEGAGRGRGLCSPSYPKKP